MPRPNIALKDGTEFVHAANSPTYYDMDDLVVKGVATPAKFRAASALPGHIQETLSSATKRISKSKGRRKAQSKPTETSDSSDDE